MVASRHLALRALKDIQESEAFEPVVLEAIKWWGGHLSSEEQSQRQSLKEQGIAWGLQRTSESFWQRLMVCIKERKRRELRRSLGLFVHILESI